MSALILTTLLLCGAVHGSFAKSQSTPEGFALGNVRTAIDHYRRNNLGRSPTTWNELSRYVDLSSINEILHANSTEPIQRNYVFVSQLGLLDQRRRRVLLIRSAPIQEQGHPSPGRYIIVLDCINPLGAITTNCGPTLHWVKEPDVTKLLKTANVQLPLPDHEAAEAAEIALKKKIQETKQWKRQDDLLILKLRFHLKLAALKSWFIKPATTNQVGNVSSPAATRIKLVPTALLGIVGISLALFGVYSRKHWGRGKAQNKS